MLALASSTTNIAAGACSASALNLAQAASGSRPPSGGAPPKVVVDSPPPAPLLLVPLLEVGSSSSFEGWFPAAQPRYKPPSNHIESPNQMSSLRTCFSQS